MIRILHTADVHLGREFPSLREKAPEYRRQLLATYERVIDLAIQQNVSLVLIAGDLFDTNSILGTPVRVVRSSFKRLEAAGIRACVLPGTHDAYGEDSVYRFMNPPPNVTVFTPQRVSQTYADLDLTVYGRAFDGTLVGTSPLQGLHLSPDSRQHVGMAHCSLAREGFSEKEAMLVRREEISGSGLDYLALGNWHSFRDSSQGTTRAFYSGAPEPTAMDQKGAGSAAMVTIHGGGRVDVERMSVGSKAFDEMRINVEFVRSLADIIEAISARADPNLILEVTLEGVPCLDYSFDPHEPEEELKGKFFHLRVVDAIQRVASVPIADCPQDTVTGRFIRAMEVRMAHCPPDEKSIYAEALRLGVALMQRGPRVID